MDMGKNTYRVINVGRAGHRRHHRHPANAQGMPSASGGYVTVTMSKMSPPARRGTGRARAARAEDIPTVGRFATIMDPQGATLSLDHLPTRLVAKQQLKEGGRR